MVSRKITLLKSQRADLGAILESHGLSPQDCKWVTLDSVHIDSLTIPALVLSSSEYAFGFDRTEDEEYSNEYWLCHLLPGTESDEDIRSAGSWKDVLSLFDIWCQSVSREMTADDPWEDAADEFSENFTESNEAFTDNELAKLDIRLDAIQRFLTDASDKSDTSVAAIESGIEELKESARRLGRKDWAMLFAGWFFMKCADWSIGQVHWGHVVTILLKGTRTFLLQG